MNSTAQRCCICHEVLNVSNHSLPTIKELLKILIGNINAKLLEKSAICETCLAKIQSAYKFKTLYLDGLRRTLTDVTVKEETNGEKCIRCEICKMSTVNQSDYIPLFSSVTESGFNLIKYLSVELESKIEENSVSCETCHKSLINFYDITNLLSVFNQDCVITINEYDIARNKKDTQEIDNDLNCSSSHLNFVDHFKVEMDFPLVDLKREEELDDFHKEFVLKNEEVDLKMENDDDSQLVKQHNENEETNLTYLLNHTNFKFENETYPVTEILKCHNCEFQAKYESVFKEHMLKHKSPDEVDMFMCEICKFKTKHKNSLKRHILSHKNSDEVEMFKCQNCEYKTKYKYYLKSHMLVHKISDEVEMFKCQICRYHTKYKNALLKHMILHKNSDEIKMFKCPSCIYTTKYKSALNKHVLIHNNSSDNMEMLKCYNCQYQTNSKVYLKRHIYRIHTVHQNPLKFKMVKCKNCEFTAKYESILKQHII